MRCHSSAKVVNFQIWVSGDGVKDNSCANLNFSLVAGNIVRLCSQFEMSGLVFDNVLIKLSIGNSAVQVPS